MGRRGSATELALAILLAVAPLGAQVKSQEDRAKEMYQEGMALYGQGRYQEALSHMQAAVAFVKDPILVYNIALCHEKLGQAQEAVTVYWRFLRMDPKTERRPKVETRIRKIAAEAGLPGEVHISSQPPEAKVNVDGRALGITPGAFTMPPGRRTISLEREGYEPTIVEITVEAGMRTELASRLIPKASPTEGTLVVEANVPGARVFLEGKDIGVVPCKAQRKPGAVSLRIEAQGHHPWSSSVVVEAGKAVTVTGRLDTIPVSDWMPNAAAWTLMGVGVASLAGAAILGGLASAEMNHGMDLWSEARSASSQQMADERYSEAEDVKGRADSQAMVANILYGVGGAALVAGVLVWIISPHTVEEPPKVSAGVGPGGLVMMGRF